MDCRPVRGWGWCSWNILAGEGRSQYPSAEWLNKIKRERAAPGDQWDGKPIVWGATQFRLCFPGAWVVMTWLWIVGLYSVWISWWLHCEGPHSLRSVYPAAGAPPELRTWTQHHGLWERKKAMSSRRIRKLIRNHARNAVLAVGWLCAWETSFPGWQWAGALAGISALRGSTLPFSGQNHVGGPNKCANFFTLQWFSKF